MKIIDFKDKHKGETCYILGNGPGLADIELDKLDFPIFGTNRIYLSGLVPDYYACVNPLVLEQFGSEISQMETVKFIPESYAELGDISLRLDPIKPIFGNPEQALWEGHTVTYVCMQLAYYMGFERVILLGVDHYFEQPANAANREMIGEGADINHFHPDYFGDGVKWHGADLSRSELAYSMAKKAFEDDGREIINCSTRTRLEIFPVEPLNYVLSQKKRRMAALVSAYYSEEFFIDKIWDLKAQTLWAKDDLEIVIICQRGSWEYDQVHIYNFHDNPRFTVVFTDDVPSVFEAWNLGAKACNARYLTYANTDDRHDPTALEIAADVLDARPEIDLTYHDSYVTWKRNQSYDEFLDEIKDGGELVLGRQEDKPGVFLWPDYTLEGLQKGCFIGPQPIWRANLHQRHGYFHPDFPTAGDYEFWLRFAKQDNIYHIPFILGLYLARHDGIEMGNKEKSNEEARRAVEMHVHNPRRIKPSNGNKPDKSVLGALPIQAWPWPRILLFVPMFPALPFASDVFNDFMLIASQGPRLAHSSLARVDVARERAAEEFLKSDCTHILMLDADHKHPPTIIQQLARWVIEDPERLVVGGMNFRRGAPFEPCAFIKDGDTYTVPWKWEPGLMKVDLIGTGSILIAREVFEQIEKPWFAKGQDEDLERWFAEDIIFSERCNDAGIDIWCDTTTTSPHMIHAYVDESMFRKYANENPELAIVTKE